MDPRFLAAYQQLGVAADQATWDASELAGEQEELSWVQLQQRALHLRHVGARLLVWGANQRPPALRTRPTRPLVSQAVLMGYFCIPERDVGIQLALNPPGEPARTAPRVWNCSDGRCKLAPLPPKAGPGPAEEADGAAATALEPALAPAAMVMPAQAAAPMLPRQYSPSGHSSEALAAQEDGEAWLDLLGKLGGGVVPLQRLESGPPASMSGALKAPVD